ncbi:CBS domain protein [Laceyella sediminis]|uniref:CBS domain protein n=1 Tax=Laceyella sediminis TaxID=573074 RepID=A0ABX5EKX1_9BACL|nr:CBS domain protein [Laceyella sediminis]
MRATHPTSLAEEGTGERQKPADHDPAVFSYSKENAFLHYLAKGVTDMFAKNAYLFSQGIESLIIPKECVTTVHPELSLDQALRVLTKEKLSSVPVINDAGEVEGVISKTNILDFVQQLNQREGDFSGLKEHAVKEAMNKTCLGILANSIFSFAFEVLLNHSYTPIIDVKGRFLGILTRKVMMEQVIEFFGAEPLPGDGLSVNKANEKRKWKVKHKKFFS